jgi:hypothetical protein
MLSGEIAIANFLVFGLTRPGLKPIIYHTQGEHDDHYIIDGFQCIYKKDIDQNTVSKSSHGKVT